MKTTKRIVSASVVTNPFYAKVTADKQALRERFASMGKVASESTHEEKGLPPVSVP